MYVGKMLGKSMWASKMSGEVRCITLCEGQGALNKRGLKKVQHSSRAHSPNGWSWHAARSPCIRMGRAPGQMRPGNITGVPVAREVHSPGRP